MDTMQIWKRTHIQFST